MWRKIPFRKTNRKIWVLRQRKYFRNKKLNGALIIKNNHTSKMELKNCRSKKKNLRSCMGFCDLVPRKTVGTRLHSSFSLKQFTIVYYEIWFVKFCLFLEVIVRYFFSINRKCHILLLKYFFYTKNAKIAVSSYKRC